MCADLLNLTAAGLARAFAGGDASPVEATEAYLRRIESTDPSVRAFIAVTADMALAQAREAEAKIAAGEQGPLTGVPLALKDLLAVKGAVTTCGSKILQGFRPAVRRLCG